MHRNSGLRAFPELARLPGLPESGLLHLLQSLSGYQYGPPSSCRPIGSDKLAEAIREASRDFVGRELWVCSISGCLAGTPVRDPGPSRYTSGVDLMGIFRAKTVADLLLSLVVAAAATAYLMTHLSRKSL